MELAIRVTLTRNTGAACDESEVFDELSDFLLSETVYAQGADNEEESGYTITNVERMGQ